MKHLSLRESAYNIIKSKLLNHEFEPGSRIREDLLAEEISMSRTPVREAINQLSTEGLIENIPRKGLFFIELQPEEIIGLLEVREVIERLAIEKCIEKINSEQIRTLKSILEKTEYELSVENYKECNELDSKFHREISLISGNGKIVKFLSEIEDYMKLARFIEKKTFAKEKVQTAISEHREILDAIVKKDCEAAARAMKKNIETMKSNLNITPRATKK